MQQRSLRTGQEHQVLVVEDDDDLRETIMLVLERDGLTVTAAANGREALVLLRRAACLPCVAVVDLMMPIMNGGELHAQLRATPSLAALPVVFMSAMGDVRPFFPAGESLPVLPKPLDLRRLLALVAGSCNGTCDHRSAASGVGEHGLQSN